MAGVLGAALARELHDFIVVDRLGVVAPAVIGGEEPKCLAVWAGDVNGARAYESPRDARAKSCCDDKCWRSVNLMAPGAAALSAEWLGSEGTSADRSPRRCNEHAGSLGRTAVGHFRAFFFLF